MIVTCPECATRYHVEPAALNQDGRTVRCAQCGHRWQARPPADAPMPLERPSPGAAGRRLVAAERPRRRRSHSLIGWAAGVMVALALASAIVGRNEIVAAFPASASVYQKLGLPVTRSLGLQFEDVSSQRLAERDVSILVVEGRIVNASNHHRSVPPIRITLLDGGGRALQHELFKAELERLPAGAVTTFSGRMVNPAAQARNFSVTFDLGAS